MHTIKSLQVSSLQSHPWQKNIPDMVGDEWVRFFEDIKERGIQEPIRVSMRSGVPVIVDGHQRVGAARELGLKEVPAIVQDFTTERDEIEFLCKAAQNRRHLTDPQKVRIAQAYEAYFKPLAQKAKVESGRNHGRGQEKSDSTVEDGKVLANLPKPIQPVNVRKEAAEAVGMSERQYAKAKQVAEKAPEPIREAWEKGEISTHLAHEVTQISKSSRDDPINKAMINKEITYPVAVKIAKDPVLSEKVRTGQTTISEAKSVVDLLVEKEKQDDERLKITVGTRMFNTLQKVLHTGSKEYLEAQQSVFFQEQYGTLREMWQEVIDHMERVLAEVHPESKTVEVQAKTVN